MWPHVSGMLGAALDVSGENGPDDALRRVLDGEWQLWIAVEPGRLVAAALTETQHHPRQKLLWVVAMGGEGAIGVALLSPLMRGYAKTIGCDAIRMHARRGWMRSGMVPPGVRHTADVLTWEI